MKSKRQKEMRRDKMSAKDMKEDKKIKGDEMRLDVSFFLLPPSFAFSFRLYFLHSSSFHGSLSWLRLRSPGAKVCLRICKVCRKKKVIETM